MATTLVVNPGSSSRKYALYEGDQVLLELRFESADAGFEMCTQITGTQQVCESVNKNEFSDSFERVVEAVQGYLFHDNPRKKLDAIVVRVVAPGSYFQEHKIVTDDYVDELKKHLKNAPLHIPVIIKEIENIRNNFKGIRLIAASDSAFHSEMPEVAREYSIPRVDAEKFDIHRFGYHGLSVASVVRRIHPLVGISPDKMIVCHIGNGVSVTAVKGGKSVETTMGFSPASGLPMGSRAGDLDGATLLEIMRIKNLRPAEADTYLNTSGGLAGLAGESDIRRLLDRRALGDRSATQALASFAYSIKKAIVSQTVALEGLDILVLTATASVRSPELRDTILAGLGYLGVKISNERNHLLIGKDGVISVRNAPVKVVVMKTDEMGEMAHVANIV